MVGDTGVGPSRRVMDAIISQSQTALTDKPRLKRKQDTNRGRAIPASVRREVFERDGGRCAFADREGRRCQSAWQVDYGAGFMAARRLGEPEESFTAPP